MKRCVVPDNDRTSLSGTFLSVPALHSPYKDSMSQSA